MMSLICTPSAAARYASKVMWTSRGLFAHQVDTGHAGNLCKPGLYVFFDQLLVTRQFRVRIVGQHAYQQRCGPGRLSTAAGEYLWLERVGRPRRRLVEIVNDVEFCRLNVCAHGERQVNKSLAAAYERVDGDYAWRVSEDVFLGFYNGRLHLFRGGCAPEIGDGNLRFLDGRQ